MSTRTYLLWEHTGWGDSMYFFGDGTSRIGGHLKRIPQAGDAVLCKMQSGRIGKFVVGDVKRMSDPPDQFFANVEFTGYEDVPVQDNSSTGGTDEWNEDDDE